MFQNSFQNGNYFQLFDPKVAQDKQKNLFKLMNINANNKVFDKDLKTYVLDFYTPSAKIVFPKQDKKDLYLIQQYLVFQIFFYPGMSWGMQLVVSDLNKVSTFVIEIQTKRRVMISPTTNKLQIKPFFVKCPNVNFKEGTWNSFAIDMYSFMEAFKGQTYRCLDNISVMGHFKLRRIYTTNTLPQGDVDCQQEAQSMKSINLLPKHFYFPPGLQHSSQLNRYSGQNLSQINLYQPTQPSTKNNSSYLKSSKNNRIISTPKTQTTKSQKIVQLGSLALTQKTGQKQFLANTNGPQMLNRMRKRQKYNESSDSQSHITDNVKTPQSTQKNEVKSKKKLVKTQLMPPKARSSVQKRQKSKIQEKQKIKSKLNPWRMNVPKRSQTSKVNPLQDESDIAQSPNTTQFKPSNKLNESISKAFDRKSDHYSESQYIELSQKFSTITDGKFLNRSNNHESVKQRLYQNNVNNGEYQNNDQIEQNIEMQTNSMYSSSNKKKQANNARDMFTNFQQEKQEMINESICDSLDRRSPRKQFEVIGRQSYYGFGERLMKDYMRQRQRPYSPPMNDRDRDHTEQEQEQQSNRDREINAPNKQQKEVELLYDPVLNCYYDHKTHTYYELKN